MSPLDMFGRRGGDDGGHKPEEPPSRKLARLAERAQQKLREAADQPGIRNDPVRLYLGGISAALDAMVEVARSVENAPAGETVLLSQDAQNRIVTDGTQFIRHEFSRVLPGLASRIRTGATIGLVVGAGVIFACGIVAGVSLRGNSATEALALEWLAACQHGKIETAPDGVRKCVLQLDPAPVVRQR